MRYIRNKAYEKYQLHWMLDHNISIEDVSDLAAIWHEDTRFDDSYLSFKEYMEEQGFNGMLWASFGEFLCTEYIDSEYMKQILSDEEYERWKEDVRILQDCDK